MLGYDHPNHKMSTIDRIPYRMVLVPCWIGKQGTNTHGTYTDEVGSKIVDGRLSNTSYSYMYFRTNYTVET